MIPIKILYNKLESLSLMPWIESVNLVERASGKASTLTLKLCNADGRFLSLWAATKGDSIAAGISPAEPDNYAIRKISAAPAPSVVTWEAEGRPTTSKKPKNRGGGSPPPTKGAIVSDKLSWDAPLTNRRLKSIAERVCDECGLTLKYVAKSNPVISYVARYNETGFHLIERLCRRYALTVRANSDTVTILAAQTTKDAKPPAKVQISSASIKKLSTSDSTVPRSIKSARLDPRSGDSVRHSSGDGDGEDIDFDFDADDAGAIYAAHVSAASSTVVDIVPRSGITAGSVVDIADIGLREVIEMRYNRTGDSESMSLTVRPV